MIDDILKLADKGQSLIKNRRLLLWLSGDFKFLAEDVETNGGKAKNKKELAGAMKAAEDAWGRTVYKQLPGGNEKTLQWTGAVGERAVREMFALLKLPADAPPPFARSSSPT